MTLPVPTDTKLVRVASADLSSDKGNSCTAAPLDDKLLTVQTEAASSIVDTEDQNLVASAPGILGSTSSVSKTLPVQANSTYPEVDKSKEGWDTWLKSNITALKTKLISTPPLIEESVKGHK